MFRSHVSFLFFNCPLHWNCVNVDDQRCICHHGPKPVILLTRENERFLRQATDKIDTIDTSEAEEEYNMLCLHISPYSAVLCKSTSGRSVVQDVLNGCSDDVRDIFVEQMPIDLVIRDKCGSRIIQFLSESYEGRYCAVILDRIRSNFVDLCYHQAANYAIQSLMTCMPTRDVVQLINIVAQDAEELAVNCHGAYVLQDLFKRITAMGPDFVDDVKRFTQLLVLLRDLVRMETELILDKHGNYTAQCMIALLDVKLGNDFAETLGENFLECTRSAGGSRVIECFLVNGCEGGQRILIDGILALNQNELDEFLQTPSAFFIVQKAVRNAFGYRRKELVRLLQKMG